MSNTIKIQIPKGLPLVVAPDKPVRKAVASLLMLKAYYKDQGLILRSEVATAADFCRVSAKTLRRRLQLLQDEKLIYLKDDCKGGAFYFADWGTIRAHFDLKHAGFTYIRDTGRDLVDVLEALAMRAPVDAQYKAYYTRIKYTPNLKNELSEVTGGKTNAAAVLQAQLNCFIAEGRGYDENQQYVLNTVRADLMVDTHYYNDMFNYHGLGSMAYKKRKLQSEGLITYVHRTYELEGHTTRRSRETMLGDVIPPVRGGTRSKPLLVMPDLITFHSPSLPRPTAQAGAKSSPLA